MEQHASDSPRAVAVAMAQAWDRWTHELSFPFRRARTSGYCINATRTGVEALRTLGVKAKPASVSMLVANRAADQLIRAGVPCEQWPDIAWSIGLGHSNDMDARGGWDGHLLIDGGDWCLDLAAEMLERPGLIGVSSALVLPALPPVGVRRMWEHDKHVFVLERAPQNNGWRRATGWTVQRHDVEHELAARTRAVLGQS